MQPATTLTMASVGGSMVGSGTSERRMSRGPWIVVARMAPSLQPVDGRGTSPATRARADVALSHI